MHQKGFFRPFIVGIAILILVIGTAGYIIVFRNSGKPHELRSEKEKIIQSEKPSEIPNDWQEYHNKKTALASGTLLS